MITFQVSEGNMTAAKYRHEFFCEVITRKLTQPRTSSLCRDVTVYKQANNIITEDMPTRSPDLYVIEHALDMLHKAVNARQPLGCEMNALL